MVSREKKILELLTELNGQTDRQLTNGIYGIGTHPSSINAECNHLAQTISVQITNLSTNL